ncbi:MAG: AAA family ATPase [Clostridiales bacterium]|nr:AAA family ATPase [Clostridiales bacterium]
MVEKREGLNLLDALSNLDPVRCSYQQWCSVGMALKAEGYDVETWDAWSQKDSGRFHDGECRKKWQSFRGSANPVTGGTIVQLAMEQGWQPSSGGHEIGWEDAIPVVGDGPVLVDRNWLEGKELPSLGLSPVRQLTRYLETLFDSSDLVGYVTQTWEKDGKFMPQKGSYDRTAGQLIEELSICDGDIGAVLGDCNPQAGAWIRFNPLDGNGVRNDNVTSYNYALVESDEMPVEEQYALMRELELPIACLVHSGGKSLHAIVRVDAGSYPEYQKRVDYLYSVCQKNGLKIDRQNRNPSRLSRMPGVRRGDRWQELLAVNLGKGSWTEWVDWVESATDDLPDTEPLANVWHDLPALSPPLIDGILRQGHKLLLAGPSKAGKSFALIELVIAIAEGGRWLGMPCAQGRVLYINLELDRASCFHRFADVYQALGLPPANIGKIDVWNLRGRSVPMDQLAPKLIRRALKQRYIAVVIDPIYKVITGDENSAEQMAAFCNQFDKVCNELGCAVIYCHHHSKGAQGSKRSMDRASGSGVFARDPDALLDMIQLPLTGEVRAQQENVAVCRALTDYLRQLGRLGDVSPDDLCTEAHGLEACKAALTGQQYGEAARLAEAAKQGEQSVTAWRIEATLREFASPPPMDVWFRYPVHQVDGSGVLGDLSPEADSPPWQRAVTQHKKSAQKQAKSKKAEFDQAVAALSLDGPPTVKELVEYFTKEDEDGVTKGPAEKTMYAWVKKYGYLIDRNTGGVVKKGEQSAPEPEN